MRIILILFCSIPLVENLKILGHYFGKNKMICDYQNFYAKLYNYDKIVSVWKQRSLTLMGKNLLINALLNTTFSFNSQIEAPPKEFLKAIESRNKAFLWDGGVSKIAHHSLIGEYSQGGIGYKDLDMFIKSINLKFIVRLKERVNSNSTILAKYWIMQYFQIPVNPTNSEEFYIFDFFDNKINILDCKFKMPKISQWKGHPFYLDLLLSYETLLNEYPQSIESLLSVPIWFNSMLGSKFNIQMSKLGFNYIKDIVYYKYKPTPFLEPDKQLIARDINISKEKISYHIKMKIEAEKNKAVVIYPFQTIKFNGKDVNVDNLRSKQFYKILIGSKVRLPKGLLNWCLELELSDPQIKTSLLFAHKCSAYTFDRVFQYKIVTNILPTNEYLARYRIKDTDLCDHCRKESDTIIHRLYECELIFSTVDKILRYITTKCNKSYTVSMIEYIFGKTGFEFLGLNHLLLELKKMIFYAKKEDLSSPYFFELFCNRIRNLMIKEKISQSEKNKFEEFLSKWKDFTAFYDFRGPDDCFTCLSD